MPKQNGPTWRIFNGNTWMIIKAVVFVLAIGAMWADLRSTVAHQQKEIDQRAMQAVVDAKFDAIDDKLTLIVEYIIPNKD